MLSKDNQPFLSLRIDHNACAAIASVNGVPIMPNIPPELGGAMTIPVNEWIANGKNIISVELTPVEGAKQIVEIHQHCEAAIILLQQKMATSKFTLLRYKP